MNRRDFMKMAMEPNVPLLIHIRYFAELRVLLMEQ